MMSSILVIYRDFGLYNGHIVKLCVNKSEVPRD